MAKNICEAACALKISFLKKHNYLNGEYHNNTITWTNSSSGHKSRIGIVGGVYGHEPHFRLQYTHTFIDGERSDLDYRIEMTSTPCYFGGKRYWFVCPLMQDNKPCRRRVGVLYIVGKYYGCRLCHHLAYQSQQKTHTGRIGMFNKYLFNDLSDREQDMRIKYWRGKPTKRYRRLLQKMNRGMDKKDTSLLQETLMECLAG